MPDGSLFDSDANKAIIFHGHAVFSYTGIAEIGKMRTDEWIAEQLIDRTGLGDGIRALIEALDKKVKFLQVSNKQLMIVVDCWSSTSKDAAIGPHTSTITNFWCKKERRFVTRTFNAFQQWIGDLPAGKGYAFCARGQNIPAEIMHALHRNVVRTMRHAGPMPTTIDAKSVARFMIEAIREVAKKNIRVGSDLMVTILPNKGLPEQEGALIQTIYAPGKRDPIMYAPTVITPTTAIKGFKAYPGPPRFPIKGGPRPR